MCSVAVRRGGIVTLRPAAAGIPLPLALGSCVRATLKYRKLRGVGKTVLLDRMRDDAEASGVHAIRIEAPEDRSLPALLAPQLRMALLRLSKLAHAEYLAVRALRAPWRVSPGP